MRRHEPPGRKVRRGFARNGAISVMHDVQNFAETRMVNLGDISGNWKAHEDAVKRESDGVLKWASYIESTQSERIMLIQEDWKNSTDDRQKAFFEGRALEASVGLESHPDGFNLGCACDECMQS